MVRIYNHRKDEVDFRDYRFEKKHHSNVPVQAIGVFDLRSTGLVPAILDQGNLGSCGPNEISNALRFCLRKDSSIDFQPSRLFIYYYARLVDGLSTSQDTGISIRGGMKSIAKYGAPKEAWWPYNISEYTIQPPEGAISAAHTHVAGFTYLSVPQDLNSIKQAIVGGFPVVIGIQVYDTFESEQALSTGIIPTPTDSNLLGGHCVALWGWNDSTERFIMSNSWGTSVGQQGWFEIPYAYIMNPNWCSDLWTIRFFK